MIDAARPADMPARRLIAGDLLAAAGAGIAVVYLTLPALAGPGLPPVLLAAVKGTMCPLFATALLLYRGRDPTAWRLALALLLSAAGDVFLALDRQGLFVQGLASFLLAHVVYLWQFLLHRPRPFRLPAVRVWLAAGLVLAIGIMLAILTPGLGKLAGPVYAYIGAIAAMALAAIALPGRGAVVAGALCFVLSDALIALDKFVAPIPHVGPAIWVTYALAQLLIVAGWRRDPVPG